MKLVFSEEVRRAIPNEILEIIKSIVAETRDTKSVQFYKLNTDLDETKLTEIIQTFSESNDTNTIKLDMDLENILITKRLVGIIKRNRQTIITEKEFFRSIMEEVE